MADQKQELNQHDQLTPVTAQRASEAIYEQIKEKILSGELKPGDKLPSERAMMDILHRSRPCVREALRMLERGGFIRIVPGSRGALILEPNTNGIEQSLSNLMRSKKITTKEMSDYRRINDVVMAEWAAKRRTEEDLAAISAILDQAEQVMGDYRRFVQLDPQFHYLVARAAKNEVACIMTQVLSASMTDSLTVRMEQLSDRERSEMIQKIHRLHRAIAKAIADGNAAEAREMTSIHLDDMRREFSVPDGDGNN